MRGLIAVLVFSATATASDPLGVYGPAPKAVYGVKTTTVTVYTMPAGRRVVTEEETVRAPAESRDEAEAAQLIKRARGLLYGTHECSLEQAEAAQRMIRQAKILRGQLPPDPVQFYVPPPPIPRAVQNVYAVPYGTRVGPATFATPTGRPAAPGIVSVPGAPFPLDGPFRRGTRAFFGFDY